MIRIIGKLAGLLFGALSEASLGQNRYSEYDDTGMPRSGSVSEGEWMLIIGVALCFGIGYWMTKVEFGTGKLIAYVVAGLLLAFGLFGGDGAMAISIAAGTIVFVGWMVGAGLGRE